MKILLTGYLGRMSNEVRLLAENRLTNRGYRRRPVAFHPHFLFASGKKKVTVEPSKEKTLSRRPRAAGGYGSKPFCPQTLQPLREHGRGA